MGKNFQKGVTLVELMIAIAIAAILLAVAAPSFRSTVVRSNLDGMASDFANAITTARTEAASRGVEVMVCANEKCTSENWKTGWYILGPDGPDDGADPDVIASFANDAGYPVSLKTQANAAVKAITFTAQGYNKAQERYVFAACEPGDSPKVIRGVTVEISGRAIQMDISTPAKAKFDNVDTKIDLGC